jgi:brefeldin A-resistance guanine nucleotide exchange factor 1
VVPPADVEELFQTVLYPLLEELIAAPSNAEMTESRLSASALLCEVFIKFGMNGVVTAKDIAERWVLFLDYLDQLVSTDQSDQLVCPSCRLCASRRADEWIRRAV